MSHIRELKVALRSIAEQGSRLGPAAPQRRQSLNPSLEGDAAKAPAGGSAAAGEGEAEGESDPDDTEATSELFVKPFPGEWADNEEDVKFHFATTTMTTPLSVEFLLDAVRVVFPGRRTARRALSSSGEWGDRQLGLHLTAPRAGGLVHVGDPAADPAPAKDGDGDAPAPEGDGARAMEVDDDEDPDRSWKR